MNQTINLPVKIGVRYGASLGAIVIGIGIIRYKTGMILRDDHTLSYVYWVIFATAVFLAVYQFKKLDPTSLVYKQTIKIGLMAGLVSGAMYTIYIVILNNYVDTNLSSQIIQYLQQQNALSNPELSKDEVSDSTQVMQMSSALRGSIYTCVCMICGVLYSVISTYITKRLSI